MLNNKYEPLNKEEVCKAVERRNPKRVPLVMSKWWGEGLQEQYGTRLKELDFVSDDVIQIGVWNMFDYRKWGLSWEFKGTGAHDSMVVIDDWAKLDEFIEKIPKPGDLEDYESKFKTSKRAKELDRYLMFTHWRFFYERPWELRGMENLMTDYYIYPEEVHKMHRALCDFYKRTITWAHKEFGPKGFWTSDDLGHQTNLMMPPEVFREFLLPYYKEMGEHIKSLDMHWWLHSCGCNTPILGDLADSGVSMFHPVQKGTMVEKEIASEFGSKIGFCAGIDVQHALQELTPDGVRAEVRQLIDTFDRPEGGMAIAAGNGIVSGTPLENIAAFLDEAVTYGRIHREKYQ